VLDRTITLLTRARRGLANKGSLAELVDDGNAAKTRYDSFPRHEIAGITIGAEGWRDELAAAGRAGGVIRSVPPGPGSRG
jgi:prephenate dehydrogenase